MAYLSLSRSLQESLQPVDRRLGPLNQSLLRAYQLLLQPNVFVHAPHGTLRLLPVFDRETCHSQKLPRIVLDEHQTSSERMRGNKQVKWPDCITGPLQRVTNFRRTPASA
jgi:hypothetical protein